jgi:hypothetical protein
VTDKDNGHHGPVNPADQPLGPPDLSPENIAAQMKVVFTKDNRSAVFYPANPDQTPNFPLALDLLAEAVRTMANILREQGPQEASRIVLVPGLPPGVDLRGRAGE